MRTYDRETYLGAKAAWDTFGPEWDLLRDISWQRGFPYPPKGSALDPRDDESPSQRAIVYLSLYDRPASTIEIVRHSRSWSEVVARIIRVESGLREIAQRGEAAALVAKASR